MPSCISTVPAGTTPVIGRFIGEDPLGFGAGDVNLSRYVGNSSPNLTDPSGMDPEAETDSASFAYTGTTEFSSIQKKDGGKGGKGGNDDSDNGAAWGLMSATASSELTDEEKKKQTPEEKDDMRGKNRVLEIMRRSSEEHTERQEEFDDTWTSTLSNLTDVETVVIAVGGAVTIVVAAKAFMVIGAGTIAKEVLDESIDLAFEWGTGYSLPPTGGVDVIQKVWKEGLAIRL